MLMLVVLLLWLLSGDGDVVDADAASGDADAADVAVSKALHASSCDLLD